MRDQIIGLVTRHCDNLRHEAAQIHSALSALSHGIAEDSWAVLVRRVHTLKGSSGSLGFDEVSGAAAALEARLRELGAAEAPARVQEIRRLNALLQTCVTGIRPETSSLLRRFA